MYNWITLLYIWNQHNIVNQLCSNIKEKINTLLIEPLTTQRLLLFKSNDTVEFWIPSLSFPWLSTKKQKNKIK